MKILDDFNHSFDSHWTQLTTGGGKLQISKSILRMGFKSARVGKYTDTQIDDYTTLSRSEHYWKPPLRMTVRARSSHSAATADSTNKTKDILRGTSGFGFWNRPFSMQGKWFTLPESVWFFYSAPPSNMALVPGISGWGWKSQVIHTTPLSVVTNTIPLILAMVFGWITGNTKPAAHWMQKFTGANEAIITEEMTKWHDYTLEWHRHESIFWVDKKLVLRVPRAPTKALGFVAWLDNEYAIATPNGELRFGKGASGPQWLDMDSVRIEKL